MNNEPKVNEGFEVVFWNARHNKQFLDALNESNGIPDVLVMVEYDSDNINNAKDKHPEYHYFLSDSTGFGILSKTPLLMHEEITHDDDSTILSFQTNGFNFYAVDISASYLNFRKTSLHFVNSNIDKQNKTIILGDFNTPLESIHFSFFETYFLNAFNDKGNGFRETWLWNMPLLSLDHVWVSKDLNILNADKIATFKSDHSMIKTVIKR
ncbi:endonuclease/exonuclease/phosphatase family protein [Hyunsoonleella sp. 2307UL5-6]|uniref:endonuclease/exonuclease/phosphatase family protein n=1 Tax=Hyunsoonleella sp. 2307UL5-6 TaxID=3384768 RepID=UPI0039BC695B